MARLADLLSVAEALAKDLAERLTQAVPHVGLGSPPACARSRMAGALRLADLAHEIRTRVRALRLALDAEVVARGDEPEPREHAGRDGPR